MTLPVVLESGAVCSRNYVSGCCSPWSRTLAMFTRTAFVLASVMSPCYRHVCQKPKWALAVFHFGCKSNRVMRNYWNWLSLNCPTLSGAFAHQFGGKLSWAPGVRSTENLHLRDLLCLLYSFFCSSWKTQACNPQLCKCSLLPLFALELLCSCCDMVAKILPPTSHERYMDADTQYSS